MSFLTESIEDINIIEVNYVCYMNLEKKYYWHSFNMPTWLLSIVSELMIFFHFLLLIFHVQNEYSQIYNLSHLYYIFLPCLFIKIDNYKYMYTYKIYSN